MKGLHIFVLAFAAILNVCAGRVFDAKQDAIKEIDNKFKEFETMQKNILATITSERKNIGTTGETETKKYLSTKSNETKIQVEKDATAVIRTAIVKAKPVAVIYCIRNVSFEGSKNITKEEESNLASVLRIRTYKIEKLDFDEYAVNSIIAGLKELIDQAKKSINDGSGVTQTVKDQALSNCESANLLLGDIEVCIHEPILSKEYVKVRQAIDRNFKTIKESLKKQFETCLTKEKFF